MPNATYGFTGTEIVNHILQYIGTSNSATQTWLQNTLALAETRYCKLHDWTFLHKYGLSLSVTNGTSIYSLSALSDGSTTYNMLARDIHQVYDSTNDIMLMKTDMRSIRKTDPNDDDGSADSFANFWAPLGRNQIKFYEPDFADNTIYIDGKIQPTALLTMSNYPTIPYEYQESFIEYVKALALDYEDDERAVNAKQQAMALIKLDISSDAQEGEEFMSIQHPDAIKTRDVSTDDINRILWTC